MVIKQALIVDDSRSARVVLKRMLEELNLVVNTVESATDAIDYLKKHHPDVIFMDHMMPGMDGFEAVKQIKSNSQTAVIPIMMYTSRAGEVYLSQARALGAIGIIPKTISPVGLKESLFKLGLIEDRRKPESEELKALDIKSNEFKSDSDKSEQQELREELLDSQATHNTYIEDLRRLMDDQTVELHKSMWLGVESVSHEIFNRLSKDLDEKLEKVQSQPGNIVDKLAVGENKLTRPMFLLSCVLILSIILNFTLLFNNNKHDDAVANVEQHMTISEAPSLAKQVLTDNSNSTAEFIEWAQGKTIEYPYNELALNDYRLNHVEELVKKALKAGYTGSIILQTHVGRFCLSRDVYGNYMLTDDNLSVSTCEYIGNHLQPSDEPATHQSLSFANYLSDSSSLNEKGIVIEVVNESRNIEIKKYPEQVPQTKVKEWNIAASVNNHVAIKLKPGSFDAAVESP